MTNSNIFESNDDGSFLAWLDKEPDIVRSIRRLKKQQLELVALVSNWQYERLQSFCKLLQDGHSKAIDDNAAMAMTLPQISSAAFNRGACAAYLAHKREINVARTQAENLAKGRLQGAAKNVEKANKRDKAIRDLAIHYFKTNPNSTNAACAAEARDFLSSKANVRLYGPVPSISRLLKKVSGAKAIALGILAMNANNGG